MNIYLISQSVNNDWDTYDSAVVCAENEEEARNIHPSRYYEFINGKAHFVYADGTKEMDTYGGWAHNIEDVEVNYIGKADHLEKGIVLASFNAG